MKVRAMVEVEDCFEHSALWEVVLDAPLDAPAVQRLGSLGRLEYRPEFPRPFFRIHLSGGPCLKGVVGTPGFRVFFGTPPPPGAVSALIEAIDGTLDA